MSDTAIDHSRALDEARSNKSQMPNAEGSHPADLHVHQNRKDAENKSDDKNDNQSHSDRLANARSGSNMARNIKAAKDVAALATQLGSLSLLKQINFIGDMPYVAAIGAALLKDIIDLVAAETIILSVVFSVLCSIFIFMMMLLVGGNGKKKKVSKFFSKIGILGLGGIADSLPGIDFLPIETITVVVIYVMELVERKMSESENK